GVRRPAGTVLADARSAVPTPEPVVRPRLPPSVSPRARRLGGSRLRPADPMHRVRRRRRGGAERRRACATLRRDQYPYLLYRGRPPRGRGTDRGLPGRAGLDLPEQDGDAPPAKPALEAVRAKAPNWQLAYTFFSPSAERLARTLPVDVANYLPLDRPAEVKAVLEALQPAALVFSKLDVWPELTLAAAQRGVKLG